MQTCTVAEAQINALNYDKGTCAGKVTDAKVVLNALGDKAATTCDFACKEGYWDDKGDTKITFTCAHNGGVTKAEGIDNWDTMEKCQGA